MARLTIYLTDDVEQRVRKAAKAAKVSISKWVAGHHVSGNVLVDWKSA